MSTKKKAKAKAKMKKVVKKTSKKVAAKKAAPKKVVKKAVTKKKATVKKAAKKVVAKKSAAKKKPAVKKPAVKKSAVKKGIVKKPVAKKPVVKKSAEKKQVRTDRKTSEKKSNMSSVKDIKTVVETKVELIPLKKVRSSMDNEPPSASADFEPYKIEKSEDYMNDAQRAHFRQLLLHWRAQLMEEVDSTVGHLKEEPNSYADPLDRASQESGFNLELRTRDRERRLIKKIEQALDMIDTREYGYCEDCGTEIGVRRLEARPTAVKCIDCKTIAEIREKQSGV